MMEREKRLRGIVFLGGRSDYTPEELTVLNVPFVCCSYANQYGTLPEAPTHRCPSLTRRRPIGP